MKVAVVGATGLVGTKMLQVLEERNFPVSELIPVASEKSEGKIIVFKNRPYKVTTPEKAITQKPDLVLFSAGANTSLKYAPMFVEVGSRVIDNSSAWRMDADKKLVVPEVNSHVLEENDWIIANPNCSTIQMVVVLKPLHDMFKIKRVVVSTYQSVTGTGVKAVEQLNNERKNGRSEIMAYPYPIDLNLIPQIDVFLDNGYTKEEMKMVNETKKIMGDESIQVTSTTVRVPVMGGHSESVNIEFEKNFELEEIRNILKNAQGVIVEDDVTNLKYPMPLYVKDKDEVFVGRIRRDFTVPNGLNLWIVADNLRKGAATNAVQIAELLIKKNILKSKSHESANAF